MSLQKKLLFIIVLPVIISTTIAVVIASFNIKNQGMTNINERSNTILDINIENWLKYHEDGSMTLEDETNKNNRNEYTFRIASLNPENVKNTATKKEADFIKNFEDNNLNNLQYNDDETNSIWVMKPVFFDNSKNCMECHSLSEKELQSNNKIRGVFIITSKLDKVQAQIKSAIYQISGFGIIIALIAIVISVFIVKKMIETFQKLINASKKISEGDLTANIEIYQKDEIGDLADSLRRMLEKLREVVSAVVNGSNQIADASNEISSSSQQVSQGASEQASSAEEISSSMEEMASNIQQNTDNAQQTEKISAKAALDIIEGSNNVNQTVEAMKKIADKVAIISDIAFQTNILALNAAVEAARAGEHGKGFAVVAAEVRKLAERSQIAANEINGLSKSSVEIAVKSGNLLNAIVPDIQKTSKLVQEITASSIEQNSGADQINNAINQLNQVTQQNAAASEEMATSSEELSSQAEQLQDIISFFKIDNNASKSRKTVTVKKSTSNKFVHLENKNVSQNHNKNKGAELQMFDNKHDVDFEKF